MPNIPGTVPFTGVVAPTGVQDTYPVIDPIYGIDGLRSVADHPERDAITTERRREGMLVYTRSDGKYWQLKPSPWIGDASDWSPADFGGGGSQGSQGIQGAAGSQGIQGVAGVQGTQGIGSQGATGAQGLQGLQGRQGSQGYQGLQGAGYQGAQGLQGFQGVAGAGQYLQTFTDADLAASILYVTHNLGTKYAAAQVYDESDRMVFPAEVTPVGPNQIAVDMTGFAPLSGTWHIVVVGGAAGGPQGLQGPGGQGPQGSQGAGYQGAQGVQGAGGQGPQGFQGAGYQGAQGAQGAGGQGPQGFQGAGFQGLAGAAGAQGYQGDLGPPGSAGPIGNQGVQGVQGLQGWQGQQGVGTQGYQGLQGFQGRQGVQGAGTQGLTGATGVGVQGYQGNQGYQGTGSQGVQGLQGWQGYQGLTGAGTQGVQGLQGTQGPQGAQGQQGFGLQGPQGTQAAAGTIGIGSLVASSTPNSILYAGGTSLLSQASNYFVFDGSSLGVGLQGPQARVHGYVGPSGVSTTLQADIAQTDMAMSYAIAANNTSGKNLSDVANVGVSAFATNGTIENIAVVALAQAGTGGTTLNYGIKARATGTGTNYAVHASTQAGGYGLLSQGTADFTPAAAGDKGLVVRAFTAQSANLLEIQDSNSNPQSIFDASGYGFLRVLTFILGAGTAITTGTNKTNQIAIERNGKIVKVFANAKTGPTGQAAIFDINVNGTSIWDSNQGNRIQIAAAQTTGTQTNFDTTLVTEGQLFSIDIDQTGSGTAGQDITVQVLLLLRNL